MMSICRRAGYSMWWGLIALVPCVNLIFLVIFSVRTWPIERELAHLRLGIKTPVKSTPSAPRRDVDALPSDAETVFAEASKLERQGEWDMAIALYDQLSTQLGASQDAQYARNCAANLRKRLQQNPST